MSSIDNAALSNLVGAATFASGPGGTGSSGRSGSGGNATSWFEAMSKAWGERLDAQANKIVEMSAAIGASGDDKPSEMIQLTAASQRFSFNAQSAATSQNSTAEGLNTIGRKQ